MASDPQDPFSLNVRGVSDLIENPINKVKGSGNTGIEGQASERYGTLSINLTDKELLALRDDYESRYAPYEAKMKPVWERNLESYLGKRKDGQWLAPEGPAASNLQFEAEETFLAASLAKNPGPVVWADNTDAGNQIANAVQTMLEFHSDQLVLRRKLAFMVRQWSIYHLGVLKYGWRTVIDENGKDIGDVDISNRPIENFIFDPDGYVDAYGDFIGALGERIEVTAEKLIEMFPKSEQYIIHECDGKLGTRVIYTEWWSENDKFCFSTFKDEVLDKHKNQYFNYAQNVTDPMTGEDVEDPESGDTMQQTTRNHFAIPKKPYTFLSVYSLQRQPHDITGLVEQNIANQNKLTNRAQQIDYNVESSNNGYAYSEENFNQETAKQASGARRKGNPILIPSGGPIDKAIMPLPAQELPSSIFDEVEMIKADIRSSWGISGIISQPDTPDTTARGQILNQANDTSRIGGGIGDAIEQVADNAFNWLVQLYAVFYDEAHFAAVMGQMQAVEFVMLTQQDMDRQLIVSVAPDSMKPKDEITQINLATTMFQEKAIGPKTLLKMVDFPNPDEAAADGVLYNLDPQAYFQMNFPQYAQQLQQMQQMNAMAAAQTNQAAGMTPGGSDVPQVDEPTPGANNGTAENPASAALKQVPMPPIQQGGPAMA